MIVERGIAPKERLRQQDLYAERMQTGEKALVLKQTMTVIKMITATLLFYQIGPLKNGASLILPSSIAKNS